jgi:hypothetical protein
MQLHKTCSCTLQIEKLLCALYAQGSDSALIMTGTFLQCYNPGQLHRVMTHIRPEDIEDDDKKGSLPKLPRESSGFIP